ncbi:MAG: LysR substrate-binding domain-containing protein [bacterium]|jgi:DNA-binding transcriptional LysR family regulator
MELRQLRCFHQVYQDKSFQQAARHLYISQQAVSYLIKNLEDELGVELFIRHNTGVQPTEYGDFFAQETRHLLTRLDSITYLIQRKSNSISGRVTIGFLLGHLGPLSRLTVSPLHTFQQLYPEIELRWISVSPRQCEEKVLAEKLDFAFSAFPTQADLFQCVKLYDFKWYVIMRPDHPLAGKKYLTVEDFSGQKLIMPKDEQHDRQQIMRSLSSSQQPAFVQVQNSFFDLVYQNILDDDALMICAEPHVAVFNPYLVTHIPFHSDLLRSQIFLLKKRGIIPSPAAALAEDYLLKKWGFKDILGRQESCQEIIPAGNSRDWDKSPAR